jgi:hypothetical protein
MNKIFVNLIETKTSYDNFYTLLRDNNYQNILDKILPLQYLIKKIENMNWIHIIKEKEIDIDSRSNSSYNTPENPFWFVLFLREIVKLPYE